MSYGAGEALQGAVYQRLPGWPALTDLVGGAIYDAVPAGALPALYVALGPDLARDRSDISGSGAEHEFTVSVVTEAAGFAGAKAVAAAVSDALVGADLALARGRLVALGFYRAKAQRIDGGARRRIELSFRARVDDGI
ncbi:DUF3168 domain-containing protein [Pseudoroseicyclus aestuarii]|uniref:Uncharacterized protein DUF3168 n=1 Tax=Pseudoroseicyclus aestuarii TaxID=1795041 RepID=A0A318T159_9RHOB|nr:DUF3168 domain-containing protein [Pseudoroseicyclus aestuarii]PYE85717.1 uncharacterized protein DUF3168 [Pseudoroseicyclus aestuarii]